MEDQEQHQQQQQQQQQQQKQKNKQEKEEEGQKKYADIRDAIRLQFFKAIHPSGNADRSTAYNVMLKIFDDKNIELKNLFQCSWCKNIYNVATRGGTAPLHRHISSCKCKPKGYVLPSTNLHLDRRPNSDAEQKGTNETKRIAGFLAKLMEIAILHGTISSEEFCSILPADGGSWPDDFLARAKTMAVSHGRRDVRVRVKRISQPPNEPATTTTTTTTTTTAKTTSISNQPQVDTASSCEHDGDDNDDGVNDKADGKSSPPKTTKKHTLKRQPKATKRLEHVPISDGPRAKRSRQAKVLAVKEISVAYKKKK